MNANRILMSATLGLAVHYVRNGRCVAGLIVRLPDAESQGKYVIRTMEVLGARLPREEGYCPWVPRDGIAEGHQAPTGAMPDDSWHPADECQR